MNTESTPTTSNQNNSPLDPVKKIVLLGAGALATAGIVFGAAGLAGAQDEDPTLDDPAPAEDSDADDADDIDRGAVRDARREAVVDQLVEDGVITQDQVDDWQAVRDALIAERDAQRIERLEGIADVLGTTIDELEAAREAGESLADIAGDNIDALVDHLVAESTEKIDQAVADGLLTQEQADERLDGLAERIEARLENGGGLGGRGGRGHHGRGHGPRGGDTDAAAPETAEVALNLT